MLSECIYKVLMASGVVTSSDACDLSGAIEAAVLEAQSKQEPVAWPVMGYGQVAIGGGKQPNGMSALLYLKMGEAREINADTTDLFPVGSEVAPDKLMACVYFKDGAAMQQTIDVLREMQQEIGYAAPVVQPDMIRPDQEALQQIIAAALYDFGGFITTRQKQLVASATDNAADTVEALKEFMEKRGINPCQDVPVLSWQCWIAAAEGKSNALAEPTERR